MWQCCIDDRRWAQRRVGAWERVVKGGPGNGSQGGECDLCEGKDVKEGRHDLE